MKSIASIRAFISFASTFKAAFWGTALVFAASNIVISLAPWLIGRLTNSLTTHEHIVFWTAMVVASSVGHTALWRIAELLYLWKLLPKVMRIDDSLFTAVVQHPYSYFVDKFTGKVSGYIINLGQGFRDLVSNFHYSYVSLAVTLPIITITMFTVNLYTGIIFGASIVLMFLIGRPLKPSASRQMRLPRLTATL